MPITVSNETRAENVARSYHTYFYYEPNLAKLADLIDDDCEIIVNRHNVPSSYTKKGYIKMLENFHSKLDKIETRFHTFSFSESTSDGYLIKTTVSSYQTGNGRKGYGIYSVIDMQKFLVSHEMKLIFICHDYHLHLVSDE